MSDFTGMIDATFKQLHIDMITEVIRACAVTCTLSFGVTLWTDCANCIFDPIGNKSSNRYQTGGPAAFTVGICPMCAGAGKIPDVQTSTVSLAPIYDYKSWIPMTTKVQSPNGFIQTVSLFSTYAELTQAKEVIVDTAIDTTVRSKFERYGKPEMCGLGSSSFVLVMWKLIENG